jgi:hypothetical protein
LQRIVLKYGTGGINIDESRVGMTQDDMDMLEAKSSKEFVGVKPFGNTDIKGLALKPNTLGRFPANLIHDNSKEVRECFPETKSGAMNSIAKANQYNTYGKMYERQVTNQASEGNASRFFKSIIYQAKASKSERGVGNIHPTVKPVALMEYLIKMVTPTNGIVLDPFMGSGSTGVACVLNDFEFVGIDLDKDYCEIARARIEGVKETQTKMF